MQPPTGRQAPRLLDQVRDAIRLRHYSICIEQAYLGWIRRYILFHHKRHPREMGRAEIEAFLSRSVIPTQICPMLNKSAADFLFQRDCPGKRLGFRQ